MIERDDAWFVRLQEGVKADLDADRHKTAARIGRARQWLARVGRGLALIAHAVMGAARAVGAYRGTGTRRKARAAARP
jgi:hypothetical protein